MRKLSLSIRASAFTAMAVLAVGCSSTTDKPATTPAVPSSSPAVTPTDKALPPAPDRRGCTQNCGSGQGGNKSVPGGLPQVPADNCGIGSYHGSECLAHMHD